MKRKKISEVFPVNTPFLVGSDIIIFVTPPSLSYPAQSAKKAGPNKLIRGGWFKTLRTGMILVGDAVSLTRRSAVLRDYCTARIQTLQGRSYSWVLGEPLVTDYKQPVKPDAYEKAIADLERMNTFTRLTTAYGGIHRGVLNQQQAGGHNVVDARGRVYANYVYADIEAAEPIPGVNPPRAPQEQIQRNIAHNQARRR